MKFILGKKIGMTQIFDEERKPVPVTLVEAGPCFVTQVKEMEKDQYLALQVGYLAKKKNIKKTEKGKEYQYLREIKIPSLGEAKVGDKIDVSIFTEGDEVKVAGISKGKGFQGVVKKWGFHGRPATHGTKHEQRTMGSAGITGMARVLKGKKMPGRMGAQRTTVKNLEIIKVDLEKNLLAIKGALPGRRGTLLEIRG